MNAVNRRFCGKKQQGCRARCIIESTTCHDHDGDNVKFKERQAAVRDAGGGRERWRAGRRDETVLFACIQRGTMWRGGKTGPGILLALRSEYETKRKEKKKKKESGGREAGEGPRVRSLFRSFINPPP